MDVYSSLSYRCLFFFFFQAEDGIRFLTVTGVQTCALPILTPNIASPLMVLFAVILLPAIIVRFYQGWFQMLYQIGRASCRERVQISVVAVSLKKKKIDVART